MKLAALYSGGKDSTYAIYRAKQMGHQVVCLITMHPVADDSELFHYHNIGVTKYLAEAMEIPLISLSTNGRSKEAELKALQEAISQAKGLYGIEGIVYGGISGNYQKKAFEDICSRLNLTVVAPLWNAEPEKYMSELLEHDFSIIIVAVSAMGLDNEWLGKEIDASTLPKLVALSKKNGFNLTFEGGEGETIVTDCPLFRKKLRINTAKTHWDGQRGTYELQDVALVEK